MVYGQNTPPVRSVTNTNAKIQDFDGGSLVSVDNCIYMYYRKGAVSFGFPVSKTVTFDKPTQAKGYCNSTTNVTGTSGLELEFALDDNSSEYKSLQLTFDLSAPDAVTGYWKVTNLLAVITGPTKPIEFTFVDDYLYALDRYSFSCSQLTLIKQLVKGEVAEKDTIQVSLFNFQVQGFPSTDVFAESFDCSSWFTITTLMGLAFLIIATSIMALGIIFLTNIKTMDRFEDSKGKTLIITATD